MTTQTFDAAAFINRLAYEGGCIVSSAACSPDEISQAVAEGRWFQLGALGFVLRRQITMSVMIPAHSVKVVGPDGTEWPVSVVHAGGLIQGTDIAPAATATVSGKNPINENIGKLPDTDHGQGFGPDSMQDA